MKNLLKMMMLFVALLGAQQMNAQTKDVMTKNADGTYVINTKTLTPKVIGYRGATPLTIYVKNDKVEKIEAQKNQETPKYFALIKKELLSKWNGKKVSKAIKMKVDGVTGATMSSDAVKENVKKGLEYYQKNK
jgi:electron transport complex protein RnfG